MASELTSFACGLSITVGTVLGLALWGAIL